MRANSNAIGLKAIRNILAGARAFEVEVEGTQVTCAVATGPSRAWPNVEGLSEATDGRPLAPELRIDQEGRSLTRGVMAQLRNLSFG